MLSNLLRAASVIFLPVVALAAAVPAEARDGYYRGDRGGDDAAIAIGAGVVGLALGAAIASSSRDRDYYYDERDYYRGNYYARPYPRYYGGYDRGYRYERRGWRGDGWRRGYDRGHHRGWGNRDRRWRY